MGREGIPGIQDNPRGVVGSGPVTAGGGREAVGGGGWWARAQSRRAEVQKTWPGGKGRRGFQGARGNAVSVYPQELLSGAMVCGVCGATIVKVSGKGGGYYGCHRAAKHGCENRISVRKRL